jgi:hypothetical protein
VRALFCVARRCSVLVFSLVMPHRCWSAEVPGLHGMQEVWGSNPHSSTGQKRNSKSRAASTAAKYRNGYASNAAPPARVGAFLVQGCWQRQRIPRGKAKAAGPLSWRNVLSPGPMTLAANAMLGRQFQHGLLPSVQTVSGGLSFGRRLVVECGCGDMVQVRDSAPLA